MFHQEPGIYRDQLSSLLRVHRELWEQRQRELQELPGELRTLYARRVARTVAGITAFVGMTAVFLSAAGMMIYFAFDIPRCIASGIGVATVSVWGLTPLAYGVSYWIADRSLERRLTPETAPDLHASLSFLKYFDPRRLVASAVGPWERRAIAWPLMGIAMTAPLMIHYVVASLLTGQPASLDEFGMWVGLTALIVGHVHYFVGVQGVSFARDVVASPVERLPTLKGRGWRALLVAAGTSLMPGLAALGIPCMVVVVTGLVFLPVSYWAFHVIAIRERAALRVVTEAQRARPPRLAAELGHEHVALGHRFLRVD